jgi:hypothetical protein
VIQSLPEIDEEAVKARINDTLARLDTNEEIAEFYDELRAQVSLRRAQLDAELIFEVNFLRAAEALLMKRMEEAHAKRLPAICFDITIDVKKDTVYDAVPLYADLMQALPLIDISKAIYKKTEYVTNGTALNKLVRDYGEGSNVGMAVRKHMTVVSGRAKLKIERKK